MKKLFLIPVLCLSVYLMASTPQPYFTSPEMPNAVHYLPGPPQANSMRFAYDTAQYNWGKSMRPTPRGEKARLDAEYSIARMAAIFSPVLGIEISEKNTPQIWKLLTDATKTTDFACDSAKITYMRKRPYMVFHEPTLIRPTKNRSAITVRIPPDIRRSDGLRLSSSAKLILPTRTRCSKKDLSMVKVVSLPVSTGRVMSMPPA